MMYFIDPVLVSRELTKHMCRMNSENPDWTKKCGEEYAKKMEVQVMQGIRTGKIILRESATKMPVIRNPNEGYRLNDAVISWSELRTWLNEKTLQAWPVIPPWVELNAEPASTKPMQTNGNDFEFSGLLNIPAKIDDWFRVIDDMTRTFYKDNEKVPNEPQAWARLWTSPPSGYGITTGKDRRGKDCLNMPGCNPLARAAFKKRWGGYAGNKPQ